MKIYGILYSIFFVIRKKLFPISQGSFKSKFLGPTGEIKANVMTATSLSLLFWAFINYAVLYNNYTQFFYFG